MKNWRRFIAAVTVLAFVASPAWAYQNAIQIPTSSPLAGTTMVGDVNSANLNFITLNSGASAPTTTSLGASGTPLSSLAGVVWHDTTTNTIKVRNQADTAWVTLLYLDETNGYGGAVSPVLSSSGAQTVGGSNHPGMFVATGAATYTLAHTTTLWNGFAFAVSAQGGAVTVSINGSDAINGGTSGTGTTIPQGYIGVFKTDGAGNWFLGFEQKGPSGVTAGTYTNPSITVDAMGHVTAASNGSATGGLLGVQVFCTGTGSNCTSTNCSSGCTYTPTSGTNSIRVTVVGAGGGGGGNVACTSTTGSAGSGGGGAEVIVATATTGFSGATVTVPAGGAGGANTGGNGTAGGNTTFIKAAGVSITANGGGAGNGGSAAAASGGPGGGLGGAAGGSISNATLIADIPGQGGGWSAWTHSSSTNFGTAGGGGSVGLGWGMGPPLIDNAGGADATYTGGYGYGFGGGGGSLCLTTTGAAHAGQAGGNGLVIVEERS